MAEPERFSDRLQIRRPVGGLVYEDAPEGLRNGFLNALERHGPPSGGWGELYTGCETALDKWSSRSDPFIDMTWIAALLNGCKWYEFYDLVETVIDAFERGYSGASAFVNDVNQVLVRNYVGYEIRDYRVERVGAREAEVAIAEARGILRDPELQAADEQFQKAIGFFNQRPQPDVENCVKDAVGAVEALARILLGKPSIQLNDAIKEIGEQRGIHKALQQMVDKLYAYRGDAPGAAHGKTGAKPPITPLDAEFVLHTSAACIVYLARLYGKAVE